MVGKLLCDHEKELTHWTHDKTKEFVRASVLEYIYCFYNVKYPETALLHVAKGVSQIIACRPVGEGSLANCL